MTYTENIKPYGDAVQSYRYVQTRFGVSQYIYSRKDFSIMNAAKFAMYFNADGTIAEREQVERFYPEYIYQPIIEYECWQGLILCSQDAMQEGVKLFPLLLTTVGGKMASEAEFARMMAHLAKTSNIKNARDAQ